MFSAMNKLDNVKGIFASISVPVTFGVTWLPWIEAGTKVVIGALGIYAAVYAARYWRLKFELLKAKQKIDIETDL